MEEEHKIGPRSVRLKVRVEIKAEWYEFEVLGATIFARGDRPWRPDLITADRRLPQLTIKEKRALRDSIHSGLQAQVRVPVRKFGHDIITDGT